MKKFAMIIGSFLFFAGAKAQTKDTVAKKETGKPATKKPIAPVSAKKRANWSYDDESPKEARRRNPKKGN